MKCQKCGAEINVTGYPQNAEKRTWIEVRWREAAYLGDHSETLLIRYDIYCRTCYEALIGKEIRYSKEA